MPPTTELTIVVPVKASASWKSRLGGEVGHRLELAEAMALDTVAVALRVARVLVVSGPELPPSFRALGADVMFEHEGDGLNGAIARALATLPGRQTVLLADLPALAEAELAGALAEHGNVMVPDADGTGTSLIAGESLVPAFGVGSRAAHRALGYRELDLPVTSGLRLDVDSPEALAAIPRERLGAHTLTAL